MAKMKKGVKAGKPMPTPTKDAPKGLKRPSGGSHPLVRGKAKKGMGGNCY